MAIALKTREQTATEDARRRQWLDRVGREMEKAAAAEPHQSPASIVRHLDNMLESTTKTDALDRTDKFAIRDEVSALKLKLFQRHVDYLLDEAISAARDRDRQAEKHELLKLANDAITATIKLGASDAIRASIKQRLDIIRETTAAGESSKAKKDAEREASRLSLSHPNERRVFTRWRDPPLTVMIGARAFTTSDWSLGGLLIDEFDDEARRPGEEIEIRVGIAPDKLYREKIVVVRNRTEDRKLAVKCRRFASALMQVRRDCDVHAMAPV